MSKDRGARASEAAREVLRLYLPELVGQLEALDLPSYRYAQISEHIFKHPELPPTACTTLPAPLRDWLTAALQPSPRIVKRTDDDNTTKLLVGLADNEAVETVVIRYPDRTTVCVSSQVGCAVGCVFCGTGRMGFRRQLTSAEIVDQVRLAHALVFPEGRRITNVVFMGMGEPLLNFKAVFAALAILRSPHGMGLRARGLSVSTVGIPAAMIELARQARQVNLALSLHAPWDDLRTRLIPIARAHPISAVMEAADKHYDLTHRKLLVEYVLLRQVNDSVECARALARLLSGRRAAVNLIVWNRVEGPWQPSPKATVLRFRKELEDRGIDVAVRASRGVAIAAACGQLATRRLEGHGTPRCDP